MRSFLCCLLLLAMTAGQAAAAEPKPEGLEGWNRYIAVTESRIADQQRDLSNYLLSVRRNHGAEGGPRGQAKER
jgi:hypothetical protein